jgi:hypothetical protein
MPPLGGSASATALVLRWGTFPQLTPLTVLQGSKNVVETQVRNSQNGMRNEGQNLLEYLRNY